MWLDGVLQTVAALAALAAADGAPPPAGQPLVRVTAPVAVRAAPAGPVVTRLGPRTRFGSPTIVPVVERRAGWLRVLTPRRPDGRPAWLRADRRLRWSTTQVRLRADLSRRRLTVSGNGWRRVFGLSSGRPASPTPTGSYAITDRIAGRAFGGTYGLAVLPLSGHQRATPTGWTGGTRLAIHGRPDGGRTPSTGCLVVRRSALAWLQRHVPLGAVVRVVA